MFFERFAVRNYKGFNQPSEITLTEGFNVITGKNNAGKTALLEALSLRLKNLPHRSVETVPRRSETLSTRPVLRIRVSFSGEEWRQQLMQQQEFYLPLPLDGDGTPFDRPIHTSLHPQFDAGKLVEYKEWLFGQAQIPFEFVGIVDEEGGISWSSPERLIGDNPKNIPSFSLYPRNYSVRPDGNRRFWYHRQQMPGVGEPESSSVKNDSDFNRDSGLCLTPLLAQSTYLFRAERLSLAQCSVGTATELSANAANLAEVLSNLQSNSARFDRFNRLVREVLEIPSVSVRNIADNKLEILVWNEAVESERDDLAVSLAESGTGVGQVLAILAVLITAETPRVIVIDEPQSFLHPGAARKLIEILQRHPVRHQYIVATHSATIISATQPQSITLVRKEGVQSQLQSLNATESAALSHCLTELGAHLSDVFGADQVLWVEGPTEEDAFRLVLQKVAGVSLGATAILGVKHTGDLEGKDAQRIYDIYNKLSAGQGLLPPAVRYIFDSEGKTDRDKDDLKRKSAGRVAFLPRRLYENYLLDAEAITALINGDEDFGCQVTTEQIHQWLEEHKPNFVKGRDVVSKDKDGKVLPWEVYGHGAELLSKLFDHFSENRVEYRKTTHSVDLTGWLAEHKPENLSELAEFLQEQLRKE